MLKHNSVATQQGESKVSLLQLIPVSKKPQRVWPIPLNGASPSQITKLQFAEYPNSSFISIYTLKWREPQWEQSVLPKITTQ